MMKIPGSESGSGSISQRHESVDHHVPVQDPLDPHVFGLPGPDQDPLVRGMDLDPDLLRIDNREIDPGFESRSIFYKK
jgi:hypothetical protein